MEVRRIGYLLQFCFYVRCMVLAYSQLDLPHQKGQP